MSERGRGRFIDPADLVRRHGERRAGVLGEAEIRRRLETLERLVGQPKTKRTPGRVLTFGPLSWSNLPANTANITGSYPLWNGSAFVTTGGFPMLRGTAGRLVTLFADIQTDVTAGSLKFALYKLGQVDLAGAVIDPTTPNGGRLVVNYTWDDAAPYEIADGSFFSLRVTTDAAFAPDGSAELIAWFAIELATY